MTKNPITRASWLIITLVIAAFSGWYYVSTDNAYRLDKQTLNNMPDVVADKVHLTQFDEKGRIKHDLVSKMMSHKPADDRYLFIKPNIRVASETQKSPWLITAEIAISLQGGALIELVDSVHLHQKIDNNKFNDILTERLYYQPNKKLAYTDKPIEFNQPGATIKAVGMQAELDKKHVRLLSQAKGAFTHANA
ncbi:LPS export ABC transporter periplasmic protein LptC [Legionella sp. W05-934-2]|jgi:LPS export ABC transporter protein LptC|uniref:LPS export ABC transporter periplasmic protein LptC n=1 Tax=Legionella sp. W05-934-2 TaxID=1198649 RepID=UPI003462593B